jgi:uncharacterized alpha/beta hydrolase family protein
MMIKYIKLILIANIAISFVLILIFSGKDWINRSIKNQTLISNSRLVPTILIPGSSASINRFNNLIKDLNLQTPVKHGVLKVLVKTNGDIEYTGSIRSNDQQPYIVIGFENNKDGFNNIKKQAAWINLAMVALKDKYHFQHFNAIGHSNGGLIWTQYFEKFSSANNTSTINLITLGSPFNFSESSDNIGRRTVMLNELIKKRSKLPSSLIVTSVAGTNDYTNDGVVPVESVLSGKYIFQKQVKSYTQITVSGDFAQHSDLPENEQVVNIITQHLNTNNQ